LPRRTVPFSGFSEIETRASLDNIDANAAVDGVDVLFIGPVDLSRDLGVFGQFDHPLVVEATHKTLTAARCAGKQAGIIVDGPIDCSKYWNLGYRFLASSSDGSLLNSAARQLAKSMKSSISQLAQHHLPKRG
jgi:4-hydroxy-2-oxoheptanedioate aldolase